MEKFNEYLAFRLPTGCEVYRSFNDAGDLVLEIVDGNIKSFAATAKIQVISQEQLDVSLQNAQSLIKLSDNPACYVRIKGAQRSVGGIHVTVCLIAAYLVGNHEVYYISSGLSNNTNHQDFAKWVGLFNGLLHSIELDGFTFVPKQLTEQMVTEVLGKENPAVVQSYTPPAFQPDPRNRPIQQSVDEEQQQKKQKAAYEANLADWKKQYEVAQREHDTALERRMKAHKDRYLSNIEKDHRTKMQVLASTIERLEEEENNAAAELEALGVFRFAAKRELKDKINQLTGQINAAQARQQKEIQDYRNLISGVDEWLKRERPKIKKEVDASYPLPKPPKRHYLPDNTRTIGQLVDNDYKRQIIDAMEFDTVYTIESLQKKSHSINALSYRTACRLISSLVSEGYIVYTNKSEKNRFKLKF